jgi:4-hydroxymandelate oxidase
MRWLSDLNDRAQRILPAEIHDYYAAGAGDEISVAEATVAWDRLRLRPHGLVDVSQVSTATSVLGTEVRTPVLVAPTAYHHGASSEGEGATATGVTRAGSLFCLSSRSGTPMEKVGATCAGGGIPWWMQVYVLPDREATANYVLRAVEAGAGALVVTGDTPVDGRRSGNQPMTVGHLPQTRVNLPELPGSRGWGHAEDITEEIISWLAEVSGLPVVVKGILRGDDARRCVEAGAAALMVSNHGGRQLDGAVAPATALPEVVAAVAGTRTEVYVDGGIRSGKHVLLALALGARAVFVGRPVLWGLAIDGASGVQRVIDELTEELGHVMRLVGACAIADLTPDLVTR